MMMMLMMMMMMMMIMMNKMKDKQDCYQQHNFKVDATKSIDKSNCGRHIWQFSLFISIILEKSDYVATGSSFFFLVGSLIVQFNIDVL